MKKEKKTRQERLKDAMFYLVSIGVALLISLFITVRYHPVFVSGSSMEPTLSNGDIMISTNSFTYDELAIGDIVVFRHDIKLIKRIIAKGGDTIVIRGGIVFVNGTESPYQFESIETAGLLSAPYTVPEGYLFCMGDNRNNSLDCRSFGAVSFDKIQYQILRKAFSKTDD